MGIKQCSRPSKLLTAMQSTAEGASQNVITQIRETYWWVVVGVIAGIAVMALYLLLIRVAVGLMVWGSIILTIVSSGFGAFYFIYNSMKLKEKNELAQIYFGYVDSTDEKKAKMYMTFGVILAIICGVAILLTLIFCKTIRVAIAVIKSAM